MSKKWFDQRLKNNMRTFQNRLKLYLETLRVVGYPKAPWPHHGEMIVWRVEISSFLDATPRITKITFLFHLISRALNECQQYLNGLVRWSTEKPFTMGTQCPHRTLESGRQMVPVSTPCKNGWGMFFYDRKLWQNRQNFFCCNAKEIKSTLLIHYLPDDQRKFLCTWITAGYQTLKKYIQYY